MAWEGALLVFGGPKLNGLVGGIVGPDSDQ
jgi:hypothetical protein